MVISKTPLRISLLGGNTDFPAYYYDNGGAILTTAIDKYVYCIVKERFDDLIYINYSIKEIVSDVNDIKHDIVREALKMVGIKGGIEITFLSDIPAEGSGLGSSSAVAVGLLNALYQYLGQQMPLGQLATKACNIEIDILKKPIGVQDQIITAYGGIRYIRLVSKDQVEVLKAKVSDEIKSDLNNSLMLFYTNKTRKSSDILKRMKLDKKILDENKKLAIQGNMYLERGEIKELGKLLDKYWQLKKKLNKKVSNKDIDKMYTNAKRAGAIGGKIVGAGGGGFLLLVVPQDKQNKVREALIGHKELKFGFSEFGSRIIFNIQ
jgi:D-glycero-alpha-D-manno-heptose-7-phosphate kinase